jgi:hypothetical protein
MIWLMLAFEIAVIAWAYSVKLTEPDMLLGPVKNYVTGLMSKRSRLEWLFNPLLLCPHCVAGQMALWTLVLFGWFHIEAVRNIIDALFFLSFTLLLVQLLNKTLND